MRHICAASHAKFRHLFTAAVCLAAVLPLFGCRRDCSTDGPDNTSDAASAPVIVSFLPSATECAYAVGLGPYIAARSRFCDFPEEVAKLPVCGDMIAFSTSVLAEVRPTHALVSSPNSPAAPFLKTIGAEIIIAETDSVTNVLAFMRILGEQFPGYTNGAYAAIEREFAPLTSPAQSCADDPPSILVCVSSNDSPWKGCFAAGGSTFYDDILRAAGFRNVCSAASGYREVTPEFIVKAKPDVIADVSGRTPETGGADWKKLPLPEHTAAIYITEDFARRPGPRLPKLYNALSNAFLRAQSDSHSDGE